MANVPYPSDPYDQQAMAKWQDAAMMEWTKRKYGRAMNVAGFELYFKRLHGGSSKDWDQRLNEQLGEAKNRAFSWYYKQSNGGGGSDTSRPTSSDPDNPSNPNYDTSRVPRLGSRYDVTAGISNIDGGPRTLTNRTVKKGGLKSTGPDERRPRTPPGLNAPTVAPAMAGSATAFSPQMAPPAAPAPTRQPQMGFAPVQSFGAPTMPAAPAAPTPMAGSGFQSMQPQQPQQIQYLAKGGKVMKCQGTPKKWGK